MKAKLIEKTILIILLIGAVLLMLLLGFPMGCKTWDYGNTYRYTIEQGKHSPGEFPIIIQGTERWGGNMVIMYDPDQMIDTVENFSYWNKLGGIMPDITDNWIEGKHQSARAAWRVDPEDPAFMYLGYIVYVYGQDKPERGYLTDYNEKRIHVPIGAEFFVAVNQYKDHWGVFVDYGGVRAEIKVDDPKLRGEKMMVAMDPYYGGNPVAPTDIEIRLEAIETTLLGEISN